MNRPANGGAPRKSRVYDPSGKLLHAEVFWAILDRERALADRGDRKFSLIVFHIAPRSSRDADPETIAQVVLSRIRRSDAAGWLDNRRIGALFANAGAEAAHKIANSIGEQIAQRTARPESEIFTYPMPAVPEGSRDFISDGTRPGEADERAPRVTTASLMDVHELLTPAFPRWKRALDVVLSSLALVVLSPLLLAMAVYIKLVSPGPVFFKQERIGRACKHFLCLKFRTMHVNAEQGQHARHMAELIEQNTPMTKLESKPDSRLIPFAKLVRASGIDELPQLINVLRGDMSLIGPRPCVPYEFDKFATWHRRRFDTLPGITGLWQVNGKNRTTFMEMMRFDVQYAGKLTPARDAGILLKTVPAVLSEIRSAATGAKKQA